MGTACRLQLSAVFVPTVPNSTFSRTWHRPGRGDPVNVDSVRAVTVLLMGNCFIN